MANMKLDGGWDITLSPTGGFERVSDAYKVAQTVKTKLLTLKGEFKYGTDLGIPWIAEILGSTKPDLATIEAYVTKAVVGTFEVSSVNSIDVSLNSRTRICDVTMSVNTIYGTVVTINETLGG